ncbi:MAG: hypothetical protein K5883_06005 [Pseudobutyrivibrio sp.]|nr:hypothetical protein [Pseudobutyrivibrio sp.]
MVRNVGNAVTQTAFAGGTANTYYTDATQCVAETKSTRKNYDQSKTKSVRVGAKKKAAEHKEEKKQSFFDKIKGKASNAAQKAGEWWNGKKTAYVKKCNQIKTSVDSIKKHVKDKAVATWQSATKFYEKHKAVINFAVGTTMIIACAVATVATGGAASVTFPAVMSAAAPMFGVALAGGVTAGIIGEANYYHQNGTTKGSLKSVVDSASQGYMVAGSIAAMASVAAPVLGPAVSGALAKAQSVVARGIIKVQTALWPLVWKYIEITNDLGQAEEDVAAGRPDFYVRPNGDVIPSNGYRYMSENASYLNELQQTMTIPAKAEGTYFTFENYCRANPGALQTPHDASVKATFDTLQIIDDIAVPYGRWGAAPYLEPITQDYKQFGPGGATQVITHLKIVLDDIVKLPK